MQSNLPRSNWREIALWLFRRRRLFQVTGDSMYPTLAPGAVVMVDPRAYRKRIPRENEIIVAQHPRQAGLRIVKRVTAVIENPAASTAGSARVILASDNEAAGADSRSFGPVPLGLVLGQVKSRLR